MISSALIEAVEPPPRPIVIVTSSNRDSKTVQS